MQKVVLASGNKGKLRELSDILRVRDVELLAQSEFSVSEVAETGLTFVENALIKARHACAHSGLPAIADDSGLEVEALNGEPGIYSSRYSGQGDTANNEKLLANLRDVENRKARFVCAMVFMRHELDPVPIICLGLWEGEIAKSPCGDNGFGYDPVFYIPELAKHSAELDAKTKNAISHRGKALALMKQQLNNL